MSYEELLFEESLCHDFFDQTTKVKLKDCKQISNLLKAVEKRLQNEFTDEASPENE